MVGTVMRGPRGAVRPPGTGSDPATRTRCASSAERGSMVTGGGVSLQLEAAKQLRGRDDDGGQAHRDRPHTHGEIESPVDEESCCDGEEVDGDGRAEMVLEERPPGLRGWRPPA